MKNKRSLLGTAQFGLVVLLFFACSLLIADDYRFTTLEDFESGSVELSSWLDQDIQPTYWNLDNTTTYNGSQYSLKLYGNTWKRQIISPVVVDSGAVFQVAAMTSSGASIQGIGFSDGFHQIFYSFSGGATLDIEAWVPVYQGANSTGSWNLYQMPIADDWYAFFDYLPQINSIIYVNDLDGVTGNKNFWIDSILDISSDLPVSPIVSISTNIITNRRVNSSREIGIQFDCQVIDPDSFSFSYLWDFGDGGTATTASAYHLFTVIDDHPYTVSLKVTDDSGKWGWESVQVGVDPGESSWPVRLNFIGDVMLARRYESAGGIIPTQGVNAIFTPTLPLLGQAADLTVANLEVVLSNTGTPHPTKSVKYRGSPNNVSGLVYAGIDVVSIANNHTLDYGLSALQQMQNNLRQNGIAFSGAGADSYEAYSPIIMSRNGLSFAFLASSDRTGQYNNAQPYLQAGYNKPGFAYMTPYYISQQIAAVEGIADLKILELHAGSEYSLSPGSNYDKSAVVDDIDQDEDYSIRTDIPHMWDVAIRHYAVDAGADLVIVHHPHIIQALEMYNGKLIAHSLGNFAFDLDYPETMPSMILYADADRDGFFNYQVRPIYIDNYLPKQPTGQLALHILDYLAMRSREMNTVLMVDEENLIGTVLEEPQTYPTFNSDYRMQLDLVQVSGTYNQTAPIKLARNGSISGVSDISPVEDEEIRLGAETIWYGNFEDEGSSLWSIPSFSTTDMIDGSRSAYFNVNSGQTTTGTIGQKCRWYDNTKSYTLHGWIKTRNVASANIVIRYYTSRTGGQVGSENITTNLTGNNEWAWFYKELTIPTNAWYYDIRLTVTGATGGSQAYFDNVGLIEWTPWLTAGQMIDLPYPNNYYFAQVRTQENPKSLMLNYSEKEYMPQQAPARLASSYSTNLVAYPSPFSETVQIDLELHREGLVELDVFNIRGQKVASLISGQVALGRHKISWTPKDRSGLSLATGIYFVRLKQGSDIVSRKILYYR